jgi:hypothetical protein
VAEVKRRAARHRLAGYQGAFKEFLEFKRTKLVVRRAKKGSQRRGVRA